jgi:hypothetical protein
MDHDRSTRIMRVTYDRVIGSRARDLDPAAIALALS